MYKSYNALRKYDAYKVGDIVDLQQSGGFNEFQRARPAEVIAVYPHFVLCKSVKCGYRECINVESGGGK